MSLALIYNGDTSLDFQELRLNVVRVPEVVARIRMAQKIWDRLEYPEFDFLNHIISEDLEFNKNTLFKKLAIAIVQVGLYDRFLKKGLTAEVMVGTKGENYALETCMGKRSFYDMITLSSAAYWAKTGGEIYPMDVCQDQRGLSVFEKNENLGWSQDVKKDHSDLNHILRNLIDKYKVKKFVAIGPSPLSQKLKYIFEKEELEFIDSIDVDPMLGWFWTELKSFDQVAGVN